MAAVGAEGAYETRLDRVAAARANLEQRLQVGAPLHGTARRGGAGRAGRRFSKRVLGLWHWSGRAEHFSRFLPALPCTCALAPSLLLASLSPACWLAGRPEQKGETRPAALLLSPMFRRSG